MSQERRLLEELHYLTKDAVISNRADELARIVPKWEAVGLLEGYNTIDKLQLAGLLQNEALVVRKTLNESTETTDIAGFNKIAFPLVKKVFDKLIAQDLVSLQTLDRASGLVFYQDFQFETSNSAGFTADTSVYQSMDTSVSGRLGGRGAGQAAGGFYDLKSWYSNRWMNRGTLALTAVDSHSIIVPWASLTGIGAGADETKPLYIAGYQLDFNSWSGADAIFTFFDTAATTASITASVGGTGMTAATIYYVPGTSIDYRGDFESISSIPSIQMKINSLPVTSTTRKIKSGWTQEGAQDLMAYHGVNAEVELTTVLSDIVSLEINNQILNNLIKAGHNAGNKAYWSTRIGKYVDDAGSTVTGMSWTSGVVSFHGTQREWNEYLVQKLIKVGNQIYKKTLRGVANKAVVSPEISTILESTMYWKMIENGPTKYSSGIEKAGTINGKIDIIKHAQFPNGKILMAYKGNEWLDTGYVYAPYIMLYMTPVVYDPDTFEPRKLVLTRDCHQVLRPEFYGLVNIVDTDVI